MATEKRLIDANALSEKIGIMKNEITHNRGGYRYCNEDEKNEWDKLDGFDSLVCDAPTVDAVEVVHGRWEDIYNGRYANPRFCCSVCKTKALYVAVQTALGNWRDEQDLSNYCHNCGAKMDGDKDG